MVASSILASRTVSLRSSCPTSEGGLLRNLSKRQIVSKCEHLEKPVKMKNLKDTYNDIAEEWSKRRPTEWMQNSIDKFISFLNHGDSVLDIGCGSGDKSLYMIENGLKVTGIDFSAEMIRIAKEQAPKGRFIVMDIEKLNLLDETFDGIFARAVLLHFPKTRIPGILSQLVNHLKKGGYLYVAVKEKREDEKDEETVRENDYGKDIERFFSFFTLPELDKLLHEAGLEMYFNAPA